MPEHVQFFFLILAIGEVLKAKPACTAQNIQDYIQADESFGVRVPLEKCRLALQLSVDSGLVRAVSYDKVPDSFNFANEIKVVKEVSLNHA